MDNEVSRMFHLWFQNVYSEGMESCCGIHMNLHNYSNTINQKTLPQKRKRTNEYLVGKCCKTVDELLKFPVRHFRTTGKQAMPLVFRAT